MTDGTLYTRHEIIDGSGYQRPSAHPISMSETFTLRDQFAIAALSSGRITGQDTSVARQAYSVADAMLEAREKKT
jgi:hypothetical protein